MSKLNGNAPYDTDFEHRLVDAVMAAIAEASRRGDTGEADIRPAETIAALVIVLARTLALLPASSPAALRSSDRQCLMTTAPITSAGRL
jgi:hypothetical protein